MVYSIDSKQITAELLAQATNAASKFPARFTLTLVYEKATSRIACVDKNPELVLTSYNIAVTYPNELA